MIPQKQQNKSLSSSQSGFTIIESLVAIIVVSILLIGIAPVIVLAVGVRVQARRVERATEAAKTYIDGIRSGAIDAPTSIVGTAPTLTQGSSILLNDAPPPTSGSLTCTTSSDYCPTPATVYCINLDETGGCQVDSASDLVVQGFRSATLATGAIANDPARGYRLGVRVYRANGFSDSTDFKKNTPTANVTQSASSGTLGDRKAPLVEMTTDIAPTGNFNGSYSNWCDRLRSTRTLPTTSNCR
ncbi:hormogonium polysaccharide secretion pseudopilin HpsB [Symplocastrum sp. BBK-W-15]|uniref:Hormogonium polysaccharide secretion pseudopilin HpsB n=2 Tax=Limnofasciculus TaxID=3064905 RepID=A0AAE3GXP0_9CYAN|nr:hormogonium polysaccharide secretion pseudopilin HpsB [Limnofasciculus baicalensis BBK-W-15]